MASVLTAGFQPPQIERKFAGQPSNKHTRRGN
jgi:hypothetical protein